MSNLLHAFTRVVGLRWRTLIGNPSDFTLETRIFHSISLGLVLLTAVYVPYNLFAGLYVASLSCAVFGGAFAFEYYRSRFRLLPYRSFLFGLMGLVILSVNYFTNSGIQGSTDLVWPTYLLLLLTICPLRRQPAWVITYLIVFGLVHVAEYRYPQLVHYPFRVGHGQFIDRITAFPIPVLGMAIVIGFFRRNYDKERATVAQRDIEKSRLLSILSHDIRAPFIQVMQYVELLGDQSLSANERIFLEQSLKKANNQTLNLVTNLLYWSRSQLEGAIIHITPLPLLTTLNNTLEIAATLAAEKDIRLELHIDSSVRVKGDADMLQLVVRNLLQNAVKFTGPGGIIRIESAIADNSCRITVSDTGKGIAPQQLETLFSGLTTPSNGTANEKGVGLGLQLCHEFIERQGGSISVKSEPGRGSVFSIELPLA